MLKRAMEVSGEEEATTEESLEATTTLAGIEESEVEEITDSVDSTPTLLGLGSFLSCLGADDTSSETVEVTVTAGTVESAEVAEVDLDVLTI
jgi:hypothetical protein